MARPLIGVVLLSLVACGDDDPPRRDTSVASDTSLTETATPDTVTPVGCGDLTFEGCCTADGSLRYCLDGVVEVAACAANETGSKCGWVADSGGFDCNEQGAPAPDAATFPYLCEGESAPADPCQGRACGFAFGASCGSCGAGLACTEAGQCEDPCTSHECGEWSGKDCGACTVAGEVCQSDGQCEPNACGNLRFEGCCDGDVTYWCDDNEVLVEDCQALYQTGCGWVPFDEDAGDGDYYYCDGSGQDPSGARPGDCDDYAFERPIR